MPVPWGEGLLFVAVGLLAATGVVFLWMVEPWLAVGILAVGVIGYVLTR